MTKRPRGTPHRCNAWCGNGEHCGLIWTNATPEEIRAILHRRRKTGGTLTHMERAPEAPPPSQVPGVRRGLTPRGRMVGDDRRSDDLPCWRVWFRPPDGHVLEPQEETP